jgi:EmrB/QacA subfamily drug resistance transporter
MTGRRLYVITFTMMLSLFLASMEVTIVATAMPTIVAQLGGLSIYAWVFSAYMLTSTTVVPIFGKLSDIYGRRRIYLIAMTIFLIGSVLCAQATSMPQLVIFRALQGLGAGGIQPLAFIIIGDIFAFEQRAKMQGWFSSVWGLSSIIGPLIGGFIVEQASWQWIFWLNLPFGLVAAVLMLVAWRDVTPRAPGQIDYAGAALLSGGIIALMLALFELRSGTPAEPVMFAFVLITSIVLFIALGWVERRATNPILPLPLFRDRLFATSIGHGFLAGFALFGTTSFLPLFVQAVLGTSATAAGATLTPQILMWVTASIIGSRLLLRINYRSLALTGMTLLVFSFAMFVLVDASTPQWWLFVLVGMGGLGMGLSIPSFLIAVQTTVPRQSLGTATATVQFSRSIGGTVGTSVLGVILAARLAVALAGLGLDPDKESIGALLDGGTNAAILIQIRGAVASAVQGVFVAALLSAILGWVVTWFAPRMRIGKRATAPSEKTAETEMPMVE